MMSARRQQLIPEHNVAWVRHLKNCTQKTDYIQFLRTVRPSAQTSRPASQLGNKLK